MRFRLLASLALSASALLLLFGCSSSDAKHSADLIAAVKASTAIYNTHDMDAYAAHYTDDFKWDSVANGAVMGRNDFIAAVGALPKGDPTLLHYQQLTLSWGNMGFLDGCSFVSTNTATGIRYRAFHGDILDFEGTSIKKMTSFNDGSQGGVALGQIEPTVPAPPLPATRSWPTPDPVATKLAPVAAQKEAFARWNSHDISSVAKILSSDASVQFSILYDPVSRGAFAAWLGVMFAAFPDLRIQEVRTFPLNDNYVGSEITLGGTNTGSYMGNAPTGKAFSVRAAYLGRYDSNGLQTVLHLYYNSAAIVKQLGLKAVAIPASK